MKAQRLFAVCLGLSLVARAFADDGFDGTWTLDKSHSELSGRFLTNQTAIEQEITILLTKETFQVRTETKGGPRAQVAADDIYLLDGKPHPFVPAARTGSGEASGERTARLDEDGRRVRILETVTRAMPEGKVTVHNEHIWTLSEDGKTLTALSVIHGPRGDIPTKRVFVRAAETLEPGL